MQSFVTAERDGYDRTKNLLQFSADARLIIGLRPNSLWRTEK
jgi:hypothetical protein